MSDSKSTRKRSLV